MKQLTAFICASVFLFSCFENNEEMPPESEKEFTEVPKTQPDRHDVNGCCCFTTEEEFLRFMPDSSADFVPVINDTLIELWCEEDTTQLSSVTIGYKDKQNHVLHAGISDYCPALNPSLDSGYYLHLMGFKNSPTVGEFNEFEIPGIAYGFTAYEPNNNYATAMIIVDKRFAVSITQYETSSTKSVIKMIEYFNFKELAAFKK